MTLEKKSKSKKNVVWVIDPFEEKLKPHSSEVKNLLEWTNEANAEIRPVYILNLSSTKQSDSPEENTDLQKAHTVETAMREYLQKIGCPSSFIPKILLTNNASVEGMIERLIHYCEDTDAEMIVVSSRGRRGIDRFIFGSFAEALLLQSKWPVYFLTHQNGTSKEERGNKILFATDFSQRSKWVFESLLKQEMVSSSEIILYNAVFLPPMMFGGPGDGMVIIPDGYFARQEEDAKIEAEKWMEQAKSRGFEISFVVQSVGISRNAAPSIIEMAKVNSVKFIAMASNSGKIGSVLFGSVAREVFSTNLFPVWICGPNS